MARKSSMSTLREISEINMTPLMDLTFILLITFIITFPLIEQGIPVNLPQGEAEELSPDQSRTIAINVKGELFLDELPVAREELVREMNDLGAASPDITVMVRADKNIYYERVVEVMKILHDAKISKMALVTEAEK